MKILGKELKESESFLKREDYYKNLWRKLEAEREKVKLGGGKKSTEKHKAKGNLLHVKE